MDDIRADETYEQLLNRVEACITRTKHYAHVATQLLGKIEHSYAVGAYSEIGYLTRKTLMKRAEQEAHEYLVGLHEHRAELVSILHRLG